MTNKKQETETLKKTESVKTDAGCQRPLTSEEENLRKGRKSLVTPSGESSTRNAKNKMRYIEGTTPLKDGCWLSD